MAFDDRHTTKQEAPTLEQPTGLAGLMHQLADYWRSLVTLGVQDQEYSVTRRVILTNQVCLLALVIMVTHVLHIPTVGLAKHWPYELLAVAGMVSMLFAFWANAKGLHLLSKAIVATMPAIIILAATFLAGREVGVQLYLFAVWTALFLIFSRKERALMFWYTVIYLGCVLVAQFVFVQSTDFMDTAPRLVYETYTIAVFYTFAFIAIVLYLFHREVGLAERHLMQQMVQVQIEQQRSESLLHNILPGAIASQLKDGFKSIAERHAHTSVLFADIVNFSGYTTTHSAEEVVGLLDSIFLCFDGIVQEQGLEKIKTVGDAYLLAGGIPHHDDDHAIRVARAALAMRDAIISLRAKGWPQLRIRIGIHHGPVIAGVLGVNRLSFDIWGPTVNLASRMESHGQPDRIHVSDAFYHEVKDQFEFEPRGTIELKGLGLMQTWFLQDERNKEDAA